MNKRCLQILEMICYWNSADWIEIIKDTVKRKIPIHLELETARAFDRNREAFLEYLIPRSIYVFIGCKNTRTIKNICCQSTNKFVRAFHSHQLLILQLNIWSKIKKCATHDNIYIPGSRYQQERV